MDNTIKINGEEYEDLDHLEEAIFDGDISERDALPHILRRAKEMEQTLGSGNVRFVAEMMNFSRNGVMAQLFVLDALEKWAGIVTDDEEKTKREMGPNGFVNPDAWIATAKEVLEKLDGHLGKK